MSICSKAFRIFMAFVLVVTLSPFVSLTSYDFAYGDETSPAAEQSTENASSSSSSSSSADETKDSSEKQSAESQNASEDEPADSAAADQKASAEESPSADTDKDVASDNDPSDPSAVEDEVPDVDVEDATATNEADDTPMVANDLGDEEGDDKPVVKSVYDSLTYAAIWNDGNDVQGKRPSLSSFDGFTLQVKVGDGDYVELTKAVAQTIGLDWDDFTSAFKLEEKNTSRWEMTLSKLMPKSVVLAGDTEATSITYQLAYDTPDSYLSEEEDGVVTYTVTTDYSAVIKWLDNSNNEGLRPSVSAAKSSYVVKRYVSGKSSATAEVVDVDDLTIEEDEDSIWTLTIANEPAYTTDGNATQYVYFVEQTSVPMPEGSDDSYKTLIENVDNYVSQTTGLYPGGELINKLEGVMHYNVNKVWKDGLSGLQEDRPDCRVLLYRIAEGSSIDDAAPVEGFDSTTVVKEDGTVVVGQSDGVDVLPKYDADGKKYIYFSKEKGLTGDYQVVIDNSGAEISQEVIDEFDADGRYALDGATLTNILEGTDDITPTKEFKAQSMQSMKNTAVTYQLQARKMVTGATWETYLDEDGETVDVTIEGFRAETMEVSGDEVVMPKYDEDGYTLEYRWIETAMSVNGGDWVEVTCDDPFAEELSYNQVDVGVVGPGVVGANGKTTAYFQPTQESGTKVVNLLQGDTEIKIEKKWSVNGTYVEVDEDGKAVIDGVTYDMNGVTATFTVTGNDGSSYTLETALDPTTRQWTAVGTYDRYDADGREISYSIQETGINGSSQTWSMNPGSLSNSIVTEDDETLLQLKGTYVNSIGPGKDIHFDVYKDWADGSDLFSRVPATVAVFYNNNGTVGDMVEGSECTLSASNNWYQRITIPAADDDDTAANYVVREVAVNGIAVDYSTSDVADYMNGSLASGKYIGTVTEDDAEDHAINYNYEVVESGSNNDRVGTYHITNRRVGELTIQLEKTWYSGEDCLPLSTCWLTARSSTAAPSARTKTSTALQVSPSRTTPTKPPTHSARTRLCPNTMNTASRFPTPSSRPA